MTSVTAQATNRPRSCATPDATTPTMLGTPLDRTSSEPAWPSPRSEWFLPRCSPPCPEALELRDATAGTADLVQLLPAMGRQQLLQGGGFAGTLVLLAASVAIFRTAVLPKWLAWFGVVAAIVLVFDALYLTIFPFWIWVFVISITMLVRQRKPARTAA